MLFRSSIASNVFFIFFSFHSFLFIIKALLGRSLRLRPLLFQIINFSVCEKRKSSFENYYIIFSKDVNSFEAISQKTKKINTIVYGRKKIQPCRVDFTEQRRYNYNMVIRLAEERDLNPIAGHDRHIAKNELENRIKQKTVFVADDPYEIIYLKKFDN